MGKSLTLLDVDQIELMLSGDIDEALVEEYYRFGTFLVSELQTVGSQIEGKLTALLGLSVGVLVSLLFGTNLKVFVPASLWTNGATAIAVLALAASAVGLFSRLWRYPSEADWFREGLTDATALKKYHIVTLLAAHQQRLKLVAFKSDCLRAADALMVASAAIIAVALLWAVIS